MSKVWYVTGASKGLGLALVKLLLERGQRVAATSRKAEDIVKELGQSDRLLAMQVDLKNEESIAGSIDKAAAHFGRLDVVVNNAGYGIGGAIEELSTTEIKDSIDVNLMATIQVIRYALPVLRRQRSGHIINISSIAGFAGTVGWSVYAAAKHAVIGLTEGLAQDVAELGIRATVIAPGAFRTEFLTQGSLVIAQKSIGDYATVHANHQKYLQMDKTQIGDPVKAAEVMLQLSEMSSPPVVLFLGSDAYNRATKKMEEQRSSIELNKSITVSTDHL